MKRLSISLFATLAAVSVAGKLAAAEPESTFGLAPSTAPQAPPTATGLPLIPDAVEPTEKPKKDAGGPPTNDKTSMAEDKLKKRIQIRQAQAKVERDPNLQALKARATDAPTDFEQRKLFLEYYTAYCDRMMKVDKTLKKEDVDAMRVSYTSRFYQTHIVPTVDPATFHKGN